MRTISMFLQLIGVVVIAALGYWVWYANWGPNPHDRIGATIADFLPPPVKDWGCGKLNQRFSAEAPTVCSPVAGGGSATPNSAPAEQPPSGAGRL